MAVVRTACSALQASPDLTALLAAVLELGNHLNAGTHRGAAAGFRLDSLLKLADVKGTDRKTSLLHFVVRQLAAARPSVLGLPTELAGLKPAALMQASCDMADWLLGGGSIGALRDAGAARRPAHRPPSAAAQLPLT